MRVFSILAFFRRKPGDPEAYLVPRQINWPSLNVNSPVNLDPGTQEVAAALTCQAFKWEWEIGLDFASA